MQNFRELDHIEIRSLNNAPTDVFECAGRPDVDILKEALSLLGHEYPVLRARIKKRRDNYVLYVPARAASDMVIDSGGRSSLLREAHRPWSSQTSTARLIVSHCDSSHSFIGFRIDHSVGDGIARNAMLYRFWDLYAHLATGQQPDVVPPSGLPEAPFSLVTERTTGTGETDEFNLMEPPRPSYRLIERRLRLERRTTADLVKAARRFKTSVHAIVAGCILAAHRNQSPLDGPMPMVCWSPVNMRNRVTPHVGETETTNFTIIHEAPVMVSRHEDPVKVGLDIKERLEHDMASHELWTGHPRRVESALDWALATVLVSSYGVMATFPRPPGLKIIDFETLSPYRVGSYPAYGAYTFDHRLSIPARYPQGPYQNAMVNNILGDVARSLHSISAGSASVHGFAGKGVT